MKDTNDELLVKDGWYRIDGTGTVSTVPHYGVQVREDTVIATWLVYDVAGKSYDLVDKFGISGKTITTDDPALIVPIACRGSKKHSFALTSGSVNLLKV